MNLDDDDMTQITQPLHQDGECASMDQVRSDSQTDPSSIWKKVKSVRSKYFHAEKATKIHDKDAINLKNRDNLNAGNGVSSIPVVSSSSSRRKITLTIKKKGKDDSHALDQDQQSTSQPFDSCCICKTSLVLMSPGERERHLNHCLDLRASEEYIKKQGLTLSVETSNHFLCFVCGKALTHHSETRRQQHLTQCFAKNQQSEEDQIDTRGKKKKKLSKSRQKRPRNQMEEYNDDQICEYTCIICKKDLSNETAKNRMKHLKTCAKLNNVSVSDIKQLQSKQKKRKSPTSKNKVYNDISGAETAQSNPELENNSNIFEAFKFGTDSRLRGKISESSSQEFLTVADWLKSLHLDQYTNAFMDSGYDTLDICSTLDMDDITLIGIEKAGHKKQLLLGAKDLQKTLVYRARIQQLDQKKRETTAKVVEREKHKESDYGSCEEAVLNVQIERPSNTQIAAEIIQEITDTNLVDEDSQDVIPTQPMKTSRFGKNSNRPGRSTPSIWSLSKVDVAADESIPYSTSENKESKSIHISPASTSESVMLQQEEVTSDVKETITPNKGLRALMSPILIEDTPISVVLTPSTASPYSKQKLTDDDTERSKRKDSIDSLLELELYPRNHGTNEVATQPRSQKPDCPSSPVLLASDSESDTEEGLFGLHTQPLIIKSEFQAAGTIDETTSYGQDNNTEVDTESVRQSLEQIVASYRRRCEKELSTLVERVKSLHQETKLRLECYSDECLLNIQHENNRANISFSFDPVALPDLEYLFGRQNTANVEQLQFATQDGEDADDEGDAMSPKTTNWQEATLNVHQLSESRSGRPTRSKRKSPKAKSPSNQKRTLVYDSMDNLSTQANSQSMNSGAVEIGSTSESDFGNCSDSEIRTVDWSKQKNDRVRRNDRITKQLFSGTRTRQVAAPKITSTTNQSTNTISPTPPDDMPDFVSMKAEELKAFLSKYGVKPGAKAFMVQMCTKIYQSQKQS